jgi:hypothetical protein
MNNDAPTSGAPGFASSSGDLGPDRSVVHSDYGQQNENQEHKRANFEENCGKEGDSNEEGNQEK